MYAYLADSLSFQPSRNFAGLTLVNWLKNRLAARQARRAMRDQIDYLRSLDRHTLEDIGLDVTALCKAYPSLARLNPHVLAFSALTGACSSR